MSEDKEEILRKEFRPKYKKIETWEDLEDSIGRKLSNEEREEFAKEFALSIAEAILRSPKLFPELSPTDVGFLMEKAEKRMEEEGE